jgi:hypothetical protein
MFWRAKIRAASSALGTRTAVLTLTLVVRNQPLYSGVLKRVNGRARQDVECFHDSRIAVQHAQNFAEVVGTALCIDAMLIKTDCVDSMSVLGPEQ